LTGGYLALFLSVQEVQTAWKDPPKIPLNGSPGFCFAIAVSSPSGVAWRTQPVQMGLPQAGLLGSGRHARVWGRGGVCGESCLDSARVEGAFARGNCLTTVCFSCIWGRSLL